MLIKLNTAQVSTYNLKTRWTWPGVELRAYEPRLTEGSISVFVEKNKIVEIKGCLKPEKCCDAITHILLGHNIICEPLTVESNAISLPDMDSP